MEAVAVLTITSSKQKGLKTYAACQSQAFMKGTVSFILGAAGLFAIQTAFQRKFPYPFQWNVLISVVAASVGSYTVTRWETQKCSDLWLLLETGQVPDRSAQVPKPDESQQRPKSTKFFFGQRSDTGSGFYHVEHLM
ncbi:transmembrane protein 141 isoform X2 [Betta splendens]|uniref:Transmembrane protein 141 isoform X2 n=1 Tax=Betta splendens TaxID=158456 RepID=A0A9W2Y661_BETSP|nr:transmembrane protein 141 isoform X2 [Betta splendens]XP_055369466.1 transmembrane protein 141 isoform X2 [Betta splendens]XP_055369467.1 transmembrane protein 141 isoform X2 [Betta splendens]